jgi:hypothetical protein
VRVGLTEERQPPQEETRPVAQLVARGRVRIGPEPLDLGQQVAQGAGGALVHARRADGL